MKPDIKKLEQFERGLNLRNMADSALPARVLGFGEISAIFQIGNDSETAYKRMPLFGSVSAAEQYAAGFQEYCDFLTRAGLTLPQAETFIVRQSDKLIVLYIAQQQLPFDRFGHRLIHSLDPEKLEPLLERIATHIEKVFRYNRRQHPTVELSIDGQISNWAWSGKKLFFIDTSTPLFRKQGREQLDPELLLQSAPAFLRWVLRVFFLDDVMNRYYDQRQVYIDLAANLYKEQRPDLVPLAVEIINRHTNGDGPPLTIKEVEKYYKEDKLIWTLFLAFRRLDRWLTTALFRKKYQFILPGKIKR